MSFSVREVNPGTKLQMAISRNPIESEEEIEQTASKASTPAKMVISGTNSSVPFVPARQEPTITQLRAKWEARQAVLRAQQDNNITNNNADEEKMQQSASKTQEPAKRTISNTNSSHTHKHSHEHSHKRPVDSSDSSDSDDEVVKNTSRKTHSPAKRTLSAKESAALAARLHRAQEESDHEDDDAPTSSQEISTTPYTTVATAEDDDLLLDEIDLEPITDPYVLPCGHTYDKRTIDDLVAAAQIKNVLPKCPNRCGPFEPQQAKPNYWAKKAIVKFSSDAAMIKRAQAVIEKKDEKIEKLINMIKDECISKKEYNNLVKSNRKMTHRINAAEKKYAHLEQSHKKEIKKLTAQHEKSERNLRAELKDIRSEGSSGRAVYISSRDDELEERVDQLESELKSIRSMTLCQRAVYVIYGTTPPKKTNNS
jgi:hypothetical protein